MKIIPTIFAHNKKEFNERFHKLLPLTKEFQIDFMDGKFVKAKSIQLSDIPKLPKNKTFEAHLMCENPEKYFAKLKKKGFSKVIVHIETLNKPEETISKAKKHNLQIFFALNPETPIGQLEPYLEEIDCVLFLGVHPGKEHQKFIPEVYKKISQLRKINQRIKIQVDGGVNSAVAKKLAKHDVNAINSGSFIAESENSKDAFKRLTAAFSN